MSHPRAALCAGGDYAPGWGPKVVEFAHNKRMTVPKRTTTRAREGEGNDSTKIPDVTLFSFCAAQKLLHKTEDHKKVII